MKLEINFTCILAKIKQFPLPKGLGNDLILDKMHKKLFSNFTHQHLISHSNSNNNTSKNTEELILQNNTQ